MHDRTHSSQAGFTLLETTMSMVLLAIIGLGVASLFAYAANNTSNTVTTTVAANADLSITKSGPSSAIAGNSFDYTITVTNNGPSNNSTGYSVTLAAQRRQGCRSQA